MEQNYQKLTEDKSEGKGVKKMAEQKSPRSGKSFKLKISKIMIGSKKSNSSTSSSDPTTPRSPCAHFFGGLSEDMPSDSKKKNSLGKYRPNSLDQCLLPVDSGASREISKETKMTSPAISGQKDNGKTDSTQAAAEETASRSSQTQEVRPTPPLTAWWRVFKLANLLMKQGC